MKKTIFYLMIFGLTACSNPIIFERTANFENLIWNRFDILEYTFDIEDAETLYDLKIRFMHTPFYATDHIVMNITLYDPSGGFRSRDYTLQLQNDAMEWLTEPKENIYSHELTIMKGVRFTETGKQKIRIENKMTKFNLTDVSGISLIIEKSPKD